MLYCSSECGSISIIQLRIVCCNTHVYTFHVCLCLLANIFLTCQTFVTNLHLLRVELRCKFPGKLHRVTGPLAHDVVLNHTFELLINTTMLLYLK